MKAKKELILWILVPLIVYLVFATVIVWPILLYEAEKRGETVSPITMLPKAWARAWLVIFILPYACMVVILAAAWLIGFFRLYRRYVKEKADSRQKM